MNLNTLNISELKTMLQTMGIYEGKSRLKKHELILEIIKNTYIPIGKPIGDSKNQVFISCEGKCVLKLQVIYNESIFMEEVNMTEKASEKGFGPRFIDWFIYYDEVGKKIGGIVTERLRISLHDYMHENNIDELSDIMLSNILDLIIHAFQNGIDYTDIHLGNILLDENNKFYLIDFDDANLLKEIYKEYLPELIYTRFINIRPGPNNSVINIHKSYIEEFAKNYISTIMGRDVNDENINNLKTLMRKIKRQERLQLLESIKNKK